MQKFNLQFLLISISVLLLFLISCKESEKDPRFVQLNNDIAKMTNDVSESDSIASSLKTILGIASMDGFDADRFQYFVDTTPTKALVLVRIPELNSVALDDRNVFMSIVDNLAGNEDGEKEEYIGIFGRRDLMLCKTPASNQNKNRLSKAPLLGYYNDSSMDQ